MTTRALIATATPAATIAASTHFTTRAGTLLEVAAGEVAWVDIFTYPLPRRSA